MLDYGCANGKLSVKKIPFFPLVQPIRTGTDVHTSIDEMEKIFQGRSSLSKYQEDMDFEPMHECHETHFNHFPSLLNEDGSPWVLGNLYLMSEAIKYPQPSHNTLYKTAQALKDHSGVLAEKGIGIFDFPSRKAKRATYAYSYHWKLIVDVQPDKEEGANEKILKVVGFYRWALQQRLFSPERPMWEEQEYEMPIPNGYGKISSKKFLKTDLTVKSSAPPSPKKLVSYSENEQTAITQGLVAIDNTEMNMVFMLSLITAARKQTVLTLRKSAFASFTGQESFKLRVGRGGSADTKKQKIFDIYIPGWLAKAIVEYVDSPRYFERLQRSIGGVDLDYVFLTSSGQPYYARRDDPLRSWYTAIPVGKAVDSFIRQQLRPRLESMGYSIKIRFHNLRATFANNLVRSNLEKVNDGSMKRSQLIYLVMERLGQSSLEQAENYIDQLEAEKLSFIAQTQIEKRFESILSGESASDE